MKKGSVKITYQRRHIDIINVATRSVNATRVNGGIAAAASA